MFAWRTCQTLASAAMFPRTVRGLRLIKSGCSLEECRALLPCLTELREFTVGWQDWRSLPPELAQLPKLKTVVVLNTPLRDFPVFLGSCVRLTQLVLRGTDITTLPHAVRALQCLRRFDCSNNPLVAVPPELGDLANLSELVLHGNGLSDVPESLTRLHQLRHLGLTGNRLPLPRRMLIHEWFPRGVLTI